jgi:flagellar FliL protein
MKKNILTVIIAVLSLVNVLLTTIMMVSVVPWAQKSDKMITDICSVLDLELASEEEDKADKVAVSDLDFFDIEDEMIVTLKAGEDGVTHYAVLMVSIAMDTTNADYKQYGETISDRASLIKNAVFNVVGEYTYEEAQGKTEEMQKQILEELREMFDSDFIYQVIFSDVKFQ